MKTSLAIVFAFLTVSVAAGATTTYNQTIDSGPNIDTQFNSPYSVTFTFAGTPAPTTDGILTVFASGDINNLDEDIEVWAEPGSSEIFLGLLFTFNGSTTDQVDSVQISQADLASFATDSSVTFRLVGLLPTNNTTFEAINLTYGIPEPTTSALALAALCLAISRRHGRRN